jgi:hypothetical protein
VRDDSSITAALEALAFEGPYQYLNLSFGTYGCTERLDGVVESDEEVPVYMTPLGLRTVLENWAGGGEMQVFAASGNDGLRPTDRAIFYPAGWARDDGGGDGDGWLYSVASDPKDGDDYSNRGWWVELQAKGTRVVSYLPDTTAWGPEDWYAWSGTSFATPCALAAHAALAAQAPGAPDLEPASMGTDPLDH